MWNAFSRTLVIYNVSYLHLVTLAKAIKAVIKESQREPRNNIIKKIVFLTLYAEFESLFKKSKFRIEKYVFYIKYYFEYLKWPTH